VRRWPLLLLVALVWLLAPAGAVAQTGQAREPGQALEMSAMRCEELLALDADSAAVVMFWLDGYLAGLTGDTLLDLGYLEGFSQDGGAFCANHPQFRLLDAAESLGLQ
jgi:acid stress chaperone HdeB